jgi:hypothetical protein
MEDFMSRVQWAHVLTPPLDEPRDRVYETYGADFRVRRTAAFADADEDLVALPDGRAYRSLSRAGLLLAAVGLEARATIAPLVAADPFSVGIYCAIENGPNDYGSAKQMADTSADDFASRYKALRSPKYYFKMLANVPPSQLGIFLGVMGPLYTYTHSRMACRQALEQAEWDLKTAVVRAALVCGAFTLDDPLLAMRTRRAVPATATLAEGAACLMLTADGVQRDWSALPDPSPSYSFGIVTDLVTLALRSLPDAELSLDRPGLVLAH